MRHSNFSGEIEVTLVEIGRIAKSWVPEGRGYVFDAGEVREALQRLVETVLENS